MASEPLADPPPGSPPPAGPPGLQPDAIAEGLGRHWKIAALVIGGCVLPLTTEIWGGIQKDRDRQAQELRQKHEAAMEDLRVRHTIEMDYLDRLKSDSERLRTLRMVAATQDGKLGAWAEQERRLVEADVDAMKKRIEQQEESSEKARKKLTEAQAASHAKGDEIQRLRAEAARQQQELLRLRAEQAGSRAVANAGLAEGIEPASGRRAEARSSENISVNGTIVTIGRLVYDCAWLSSCYRSCGDARDHEGPIIGCKACLESHCDMLSR